METDILIAASLILLSIAASLAIILKIARAVREEPRLPAAPLKRAALRSTAGW